MGLEVAANQRLCAAGADSDPLPIRQEELIAIGSDKFFHFEWADGFQPSLKLCQQCILFLRCKGDIDAVGIKVPNLFGKFSQDLAERFFLCGNEFSHEK